MHFSLSVIASLLPLSLAAPYAYAPPPPTNEQWQAAAANLKVNSLFSSSASTGSGSNSGSSGKGETLLRDAAIFSAGRQGASSVPGRSEHIKVRRRLDKGHSGMHSRKVKVSNKRRACTAKAGTELAQAPVMLAAGVPSASASAAASASSVSASAEAPAQSESVEGYSAESETPAVESDSNGIVGGVVDALFPMSVRSKWSTAQSEGSALSFDDAFKPLAAGKLPPTTPAPDGTLGLYSSFPANTFKYSASTGAGFSFYSPGPSSVDLSSATEVLMSYSVYFSEDFDFVKGGKLPGLYGGASEDEAKSCSGGRQDNRGRCFSARMMWRKEGMGELYNYFPTDVQQGGGYCETAPMSHCDAKFGDSIGRGAFTFPSGKWTTLTQRLKLNTPASESNGEQELWVDGKQVINLSGLRIRTTDETRIYGVMAQTFFGGGDASWASTKDQGAWFKDWSLGVIA